MHNFDRQFVDVPILSVQSDLPDEHDWLMSARNNESYKAYATSFVIKDLVDQLEDNTNEEQKEELVSKLTFMYHYVMNFRSKYTRELRTNVRRRVITAEVHELGTSHVASISFALKEAKSIMDRKKVAMKAQVQGTMIDTHQKWVHLNEMEEHKRREREVDEETKESPYVHPIVSMTD